MAMLLERTTELAALDDLVAHGGLLTVEGPAGIGKSELLHEAIARAQAAGRTVMKASGAVLETAHPFGVAGDLLGPVGADAVITGDGADPSGFTVMRGLSTLVTTTADRHPLLLVVDDAHWADEPSLLFLAFLARRLDGPDIALCVAMRNGEPNAPESLLDELRAHARARVHPPALSAAATTALLTDAGLPVRHHDACHEATGGNPLLVREVARAGLDGEDPVQAAASGLASMVRRRIERVGPDALAVARAAAVLGDDATLALVAKLCGDPVAVGQVIGDLVRAEILNGSEPYEFNHPLVAAAVLEELDAGTELALRQAAVHGLSAVGASADQLAAQVLAMPATADPDAVEILTGAADAALARGAPSTAVTLLRRALDEPPPGDRRAAVLHALGHAERLAGSPAAIERLRLARELTADATARAEISRELAFAQFDLARYSEAAATATEALRELPPDTPPQLRDALRIDLLSVGLFAPPVNMARSLAELQAGPAPQDPAVQATFRIPELTLRLARGEPIAGLGPEIETVVAQLPPSPTRLDVQTPMWFALIAFERFEGVERLIAAAEADTRTQFMRKTFAINVARGWLSHRCGDLMAAVLHFETIVELGRAQTEGQPFTMARMASPLVDLGDLDRARALVDCSPIPPGATDRQYAAIHWAHGRVFAAQGDDDAALRAYDAGNALIRSFPYDTYPVWEEGGGDRIECLLRLGRADEAADEVAHVLAIARRIGLRGLEGIGLRLSGLISGDLDVRRQAVDALAGTPLRLEHARALRDLGGGLRRGGERTAAREPLRAALDIAAACGATPLAREIREELAAAGARPRREALTGRDALTASEQRVARLAAAGLSNREIAQRLFVTPKTVEGHLANCFRKLGVTSRGDIAATLSET